MARRSRMSIVKRQRELKKSEKAATKRAKRFGHPIPGVVEPRPTVGAGALDDADRDEDTEPEGNDRENPSEDVPKAT